MQFPEQPSFVSYKSRHGSVFMITEWKRATIWVKFTVGHLKRKKILFLQNFFPRRSHKRIAWQNHQCFCVQVKPVTFTVQAIVTSSDLQFDQTEVDFGYCSVYQSVRSSVLLTNLSLLPQDFGFMSVPEVQYENPARWNGTLTSHFFF